MLIVVCLCVAVGCYCLLVGLVALGVLFVIVLVVDVCDVCCCVLIVGC